MRTKNTQGNALLSLTIKSSKQGISWITKWPSLPEYQNEAKKNEGKHKATERKYEWHMYPSGRKRNQHGAAALEGVSVAAYSTAQGKLLAGGGVLHVQRALLPLHAHRLYREHHLKELYTSISNLAQKLVLTLLNNEFILKFKFWPRSDKKSANVFG